jgi:hypothetical protein
MEIVDVTYLGTTPQYQEYDPSDLSLVNKALITPTFSSLTDYIELFIKDQAGTVIGSNYDVTKYNIGDNINPVDGNTSTLYLDPETDAKDQGFNRGSVNVKYNFFRKFIASGPNPSQNFWIKEISTTRTEIKVARQDLSNLELATAFNEFNGQLGTDAYYPDFLLNFGRDIQIIGVNAVYVDEDGEGYIIFKLYEPLPDEFDVKATFWVVYQVAEPAEFNVTINVTPELLETSRPLRGPNYKVNITDRIGKTTPYYNYSSLLLTSVTSSYQQIKSLMDEKGIQINVDYSNFSNFIHFSSATERLYNFVYKLQTIESASATLASTSYSASRITLQNEIDATIEKFDGWEYYLYFESASTSWPKSSTTQPYPLYSVTSSQAKNWLGSTNIVPTATTMSMYFSSSYYDDQNKDWLVYATPSYIQDDAANAPYLVFLDMIGQHFDNIWIYLKDLSNRYSAENNPFVGVSMDQVGDSLRSFGIDLYTNTNVSDNIYYSLFGINQTGSALPVTSSLYSRVNIASSSLFPLAGQPYLTASLSLPPFGQEKINRYVTTFVTASAGVTSSFATLPAEQLKNEIYKRLYHNLAYLLKTKGTERGVKALICTYGIPEDILTVNEYGGYNIYEIAGIQELNNNNITTGSALTISSSLLSPYTTLQYYQNNLDKTSADIEVGFSPTDRLNAAITSSGIVTASNQPGYFNIMQYIGAPNLQYSSSYFPLDQLETTFFNATMTGNSQTGLQRFNVWDFIRTVKYYNNSLFKMMKDWVPARTNLSSGIIIRSHILERNKYARHEPYVIISGSLAMINMISITGSDAQGILYNTSYTASVPVQYQSNSVYLGNQSGSVLIASSTGIENFTGEYSGSYIDIPNTFPQVGISSYEYPWTSSVAPSQHGGANVMFTTYSISYLVNNVSGSVISQKFLDLDYSTNQIVPVNYGLVTKSLYESTIIGPVSQSQQPYSMYAQLQDYNYYLRRSIQPRYSGSYLSGLYYNVFTTQSVSYSGDISYGNDPVINYYSGKLGLFTQVATSSFIPGKVNASLAYFADVSGGLFELNQNNKNWQDLQNIFVAGETLTVKQFDTKQYSNQTDTDGVKVIYNSGYNYTPQLYFATARDTQLYFAYAGNSSLGDVQANNSGLANNNIAGVGSPSYAPNANGYIYNVFNNEISDTNNYYAAGNTVALTFPSFSAPYTGVRTFVANLSIPVAFSATNQQVTYSFNIKNNGTTLTNGTAIGSFKSTSTPGGTTNGTVNVNAPLGTIKSGASTPVKTVYTGPFDVYDSSGLYVGTTAAGSWISASFYTAVPYMVGFNDFVAYAKTFAESFNDSSGVLSTYIVTFGVGSQSTPLTNLSNFSTSPSADQLTTTINLNVSTTATSFAAGDDVTFELLQNLTSSVGTFTATISPGLLTISENNSQGDYAVASSNVTPFIQDLDNLTTETDTGLIVLNQSLTSYYGYDFVPYFVSGGVAYSSSLYGAYGDINTAFLPQEGDKIIMRDTSGIVQDLDVKSAEIVVSNLHIKVVPSILPNWTATPALVTTFLLLRTYEDEQNVIMTFNKPPGQTSYGFIIPNTVSPEITNNINTLQAAVQSQLLSNPTNPSIDTINGGSFS